MAKKFATALPKMSFRKTPREGQLKAVKACFGRDRLNIQLPTGYGKSFTACAVYAVKQHEGINRLLMIFPTETQLRQFEQDGHNDLSDAGVKGPHKVMDVRYWNIEAVKSHNKNTCQVFAITIQSLIKNGAGSIVHELMQSGRWAVVVDEHHHYGAGKCWGDKVLSLNPAFMLAMSATPYRPGDDGVFGKPEIVVTYKKAFWEKAVKGLVAHSYEYAIDIVDKENNLTTKKTSELTAEAGEDPEKIEDFMNKRQLRWSAKYVSPLVRIPIDRMLNDRVQTGFKLQAIVGALCVSHAKVVCEQIRGMYPELNVDWVGTGSNGRTDQENLEIIKKFCPPKNDNGVRDAPDLDILVHVGMAGEGLDTVNVSEVVFLKKASINNCNMQVVGRAARFLSPNIQGHISFDSSSELSSYSGSKIMSIFDEEDEGFSDNEDEPKTEKDGEETLRELPSFDELLRQFITNIRLVDVDSGDWFEPENHNSETNLKKAKELVSLLHSKTGQHKYKDFSVNDFDENHPLWSEINEIFSKRVEVNNKIQDEKNRIEFLKSQLQSAVSSLASDYIKTNVSQNMRMDKNLRGDIMKRINTRKMQLFGRVNNDIETLEKHYRWVCDVQQMIIKREIPAWLA